jgi:putative ATPase
MEDLFESLQQPNVPDGAAPRAPLAARMRPECLEDIFGQDHILGPGKLLRRVIEADRLSSIILYGPPGCGKTTLAEVIAKTTRRRFTRASGVMSNVAALREIMETARKFAGERGTILFIDEIHRFNKAQQDVLLPYVEEGTVTLIGATTHNPQVFVNTPLTSRSLVFELKPLSVEAVVALLRRALAEPVRGLGDCGIVADDDALAHLAESCEGDARRALNALEVAALSTPKGDDGLCHLTREVMEESVQRKMIAYDRDEDGHYNTISAFIKSVRGSDPHAACYWLAKMLVAGEDPRFIARRLVILASEDIGNADPRGLSVAVAAMQAVEFIGMPEARITLAQATTYLATAPKSNAAYLAVDAAMEDVRTGRVLEVPEALRNLHLRAVGKEKAADYVYPHDFEGHFTPQDYLPAPRVYYRPTEHGYEDLIGKRMAAWDAQRRAKAPPPSTPSDGGR